MSTLQFNILWTTLLIACNATGSQVIPNDWPSDCQEKTLYFLDEDNDGFGRSSQSIEACSAEEGWVDKDGDCDDDDPQKHPEAIEACDTIDNDCSGLIDDNEACPCLVESREEDADYLFCGASISWNEALNRCESYNRQLTIIENEEENNWLTGVLDSRLPGIWWIGMSDTEEEGVWRWIDGSMVELDAWHNGEPNDYGGEDCGEIYRWGIETWNDAPCDARNNFICESIDL